MPKYVFPFTKSDYAAILSMPAGSYHYDGTIGVLQRVPDAVQIHAPVDGTLSYDGTANALVVTGVDGSLWVFAHAHPRGATGGAPSGPIKAGEPIGREVQITGQDTPSLALTHKNPAGEFQDPFQALLADGAWYPEVYLAQQGPGGSARPQTIERQTPSAPQASNLAAQQGQANQLAVAGAGNQALAAAMSQPIQLEWWQIGLMVLLAGGGGYFLAK